MDVKFESAHSVVLSAAYLTENVAILTPTDVTYASIVLSKVAALSGIEHEVSRLIIINSCICTHNCYEKLILHQAVLKLLSQYKFEKAK